MLPLFLAHSSSRSVFKMSDAARSISLPFSDLGDLSRGRLILPSARESGLEVDVDSPGNRTTQVDSGLMDSPRRAWHRFESDVCGYHGRVVHSSSSLMCSTSGSDGWAEETSGDTRVRESSSDALREEAKNRRTTHVTGRQLTACFGDNIFSMGTNKTNLFSFFFSFLQVALWTVDMRMINFPYPVVLPFRGQSRKLYLFQGEVKPIFG
jgi:hypothetical protein